MATHRTPPSAATVHASGWSPLDDEWEVTALPLVDERHHLPNGEPLFARLTYADALEVAARERAALLSESGLRELGRVGLQLVPFLGTPKAETDIVHSERHDAAVWQQLVERGWDGRRPVSGAGKHWLSGAPDGRSRLGGWDVDGPGPGARLWQEPAVAHNRAHFDDGTTTVLIRRRTQSSPPSGEPQHSPSGLPTLTDAKPGGGGVLRRGTRGSEVERLQRALGVTADGIFGEHTERAVRVFQAARGLTVDGIVGPMTWRALEVSERDTDPPAPATSPGPTSYPPSTWLGAKNFTAASRRTAEVRLAVLHSTENPVRVGVAENVAKWFASRGAPRASAHYVVGPETIFQCVAEHDVAWTAPGANRDGINIELVGQALRTEWLRAGDDDAAGLAVLERAAPLVRAICRRYELPVARVDASGLLRGERGLTTHAAVTAAYKRSTHVDPGGMNDSRWPWPEFLAMVRG